jgi:hypothetical protein
MVSLSSCLRTFVVTAGLWAAPAAHAQVWFQFAVIGDAPYFAFEEAQVAATLQALAREPVAFVIHVGDIKGGGRPCSDELFADRLALLDASPLPLVLTPGDNEWTDCHRTAAGGHDPLERLARLRELFFAGGESLGRRRIRLERQPGRPENARWRHEGVLFVTLNIPGSENNARMPDERDARMADNFRWLEAAAVEAARPDVRALVVVAHAEPGLHRSPGARDPYASFRAALARHAARIAKPLLLVHGDDHRYAFDRPLRDPRTGQSVTGVQRVSPYGSPSMAPAIVSVTAAAQPAFDARPGLPP